MRFASFAAKRFSGACGKGPPSNPGESFSMSGPADDVAIRRARLSDAPFVAELSGQLGYPTPEKEITVRLAHLIRHPRLGAVLIAESSEGTVIGWLHVSVTPLLEIELHAEVNGLIVADGHRSSGAGAKLLQAAE